MKPWSNLQVGRGFESDNVALLLSTWTPTGTGSGGDPVQLAGQTSDVVRRQSHGVWLFIDNPYGLQQASEEF